MVHQLLYESDDGWIATLVITEKLDFITELEFETYFEVKSKETIEEDKKLEYHIIITFNDALHGLYKDLDQEARKDEFKKYIFKELRDTQPFDLLWKVRYHDRKRNHVWFKVSWDKDQHMKYLI